MNIFFVGMKIVCVDDADPQKPFPYQMPNRPVYGGVYTVREVQINYAGETGIWVHELSNPNCRPGSSVLARSTRYPFLALVAFG